MADQDIEKIVREYLTKTIHMSLGTARDNKPWVSEVHFVYDDDLNLYFVSMTNTRHCQEIANNPHVAGSIAKQHLLGEAPNGIYFEGQAEMIEATAEDVERYCDALGRDVVEVTEMLKQVDGRRMYKITVRNWAAFGNFDGNGHKKYEMKWGRS